MKLAKVTRAVVAAGLAVACLGGIAACSSGSGSGSTGGVAATVNGTAIQEDRVTNMIQGIRAQYGLDEADAWGQYLAAYGMTPESIREQMVDSFVNRELVRLAAEEKGMSVDASEVQSYVDTMRANYSTEEQWQEALKGAGFTEDEYRQTIETSLLQQQLNTYFTDQVSMSDEDVLESAKTYITYYDGARRSSHILFAADDEATARDVLDRIKNGSLDFGDAAKQYSLDGSGADGGDVGWDALSNFVSEYTTALKALEKDQVSDLVTSQFGIHIIKCTDVFNAPSELTSMDQIPAEFRDTMERMAKSQQAQADYQAFIDEVREKADIVVNDMPANVPYNVDLSKYQTASASAESASAESEPAAASAESASAESASAESASASAASASASADSAKAA